MITWNEPIGFWKICHPGRRRLCLLQYKNAINFSWCWRFRCWPGVCPAFGALFVTDGASGLSGLAAYLAYRFHYGQNQLGDWFLYGVPRLLDCSGAVFFAAVGFFAAETETPLKEKGGAYVLRVFYAAFSRLGGALSKS